MGHIDDFIVDEASWQIRYLVIDTSNWMGGKWVAISPSSVKKVDWPNQSVVLNLTRDEIRKSPTRRSRRSRRRRRRARAR